MLLKGRAEHEQTDTGKDEAVPSAEVYDKHPSDVIRVVVGVVVLLFASLVAWRGRVGLLEIDIFNLINRLPSPFAPMLGIVSLAGTIFGVAVFVGVAFVRERKRLALELLGAALGAWLLAEGLDLIISRGSPPELLGDLVTRQRLFAGLGFPSTEIAVLTALVTVASPSLRRGWRRALWGVVIVSGIAHIYLGGAWPVDIVGGLALGWIVGAGTLLLGGSPTWRMSADELIDALDNAGVHVTQAKPASGDARGSVPFLASNDDGSNYFVKVVGRDERNADFLFKTYRFLAYRGVEDEAPFATPKRNVEHEAYLELLATRAGVRTPTMVASFATPLGDGVLVQEGLRAVDLENKPAESIDDELLSRIWGLVRRMRSARLAHRDLRLANLMVDEDGKPWLIDFGFAEAAASDRRLAQDAAELLASTALLVGAERAVRPALEQVGNDGIVEAAGFLQKAALSRATRGELHEHDGLLDNLRSEIATATATELPTPLDIGRLKTEGRVLFGIVVLVLAIHLILPQIGELGQTINAIRDANFGWLAIAFLASALTYLMAGLAIVGCSPIRLIFGRTVLVQIAASFAGRLVPNVGGLGLNVLYLVRQGVGRTEAVSAIGLSAVASMICHLSLLTGAALFGGATGFKLPKIPGGWGLLLALAVFAVIVGIAMGFTAVGKRAVTSIKIGLRSVTDVLRHPSKATQLFGGSLFSIVFYIVALAACMAAFDAGVTINQVALVFLVGGAIGSASPTPGGLGAVEAALIAGFTALGVNPGVAVAGVLSYRLVTFWAPILPGMVIYHRMHETELL